MKMSAIYLTLLFTFSVLAAEDCEIVRHPPGFHKSNLSLYFAQEYTGSDLVREEILKNKISIDPNLMGIIDSDMQHHGYSAMNLMSSQTFTAPIPELSPTLKSKFDQTFYTEGIEAHRNGPEIWNQYADKCGKQKNCPAFMNMSMIIKVPLIPTKVSWHKALENLTKQKVIVIAASGNDHEDKTIPGRMVVPVLSDEASEAYNFVLIGSTSPTGRVSDFSDGSKNVVITAPSEFNVLTAGYMGRNKTTIEYEKFGGTSGAAPQVTAALVIFEAVSGYHPTLEETKTLLIKSAIKLKHSQAEEKRHGAGNLNTLKIFEIAKKIKKECEGRPACSSSMIDLDSTYVFTTDSIEMIAARKAFLSCFEPKATAVEASCEQKITALKSLRRQSLLNPADKETLLGLSCIYNSMYLVKNATYYEAVSKYN